MAQGKDVLEIFVIPFSFAIDLSTCNCYNRTKDMALALYNHQSFWFHPGFNLQKCSNWLKYHTLSNIFWSCRIPCWFINEDKCFMHIHACISGFEGFIMSTSNTTFDTTNTIDLGFVHGCMWFCTLLFWNNVYEFYLKSCMKSIMTEAKNSHV